LTAKKDAALTDPVNANSAATEGRGLLAPPGCRVALALERSAGSGLDLLRRSPDLRRLYIVGTCASQAPDPRITPIQLQADIPVEQSLEKAFENDLLCFAEGKVSLLVTDQDYQAEPILCSVLSNVLLSHTRRVLSTVALHATRGWHMLANSCLNLPRALQEHALTELAGLARGKAVVLVGAGPSLDKNVADLRAGQERIFIVACDAACATLIQAGIRPDLVVTTDDSERIWRYFGPLGAALSQVPVACLLQSSWPVIRYHRGPIYFGLSESPSGAFFHEATGLPFFNVGQCVGHAALDIAVLLGGSPIIMIGFDLGYSGDRFHPKDMTLPYFHLKPPPQENLTTVTGIDGKPIVTDLSMEMYLREFERRIARLSIPIWDATEGGALKKGPRLLTLKQALEEIPAASTQRGIIDSAVKNPPLAFHDLKDRWLRLLGKFFLDMDAWISQPGVPDLHAFLKAHQEIVSLLADTDNLADIAAFKYAWEDWKQHRIGEEEMRQRVMLQLNDLAGYARLIPLLLEFPTPSTTPRKIMFVVNPALPSATGQRLFQSLEKLRMEVVTFTGDPSNLPAFWETVTQQAIDLIIAEDGSVMPAAWAMPGLPCIEWKSHPPEDSIIPEQWMPGYAVVCADSDIAQAWRAKIPKERPVMFLSAEGALFPAGAPESPENWQFFLNKLSAEI
jgi:hypothetical protein